MNDKFSKLRSDAAEFAFAQRFIPGEPKEITEVIFEKFAELIVLQCAQISEDNFHHGSAGARAMKEYFGVTQ